MYVPSTVLGILHIFIYLILLTTQIRKKLISPKPCWDGNRHRDVKLLAQSYMESVTKDKIYTKPSIHFSVFSVEPFPQGDTNTCNSQISLLHSLKDGNRAMEMTARLLLAYASFRQEYRFP